MVLQKYLREQHIKEEMRKKAQIKAINIHNLRMRIQYISNRPGAKETLVFREPAEDNDYSQWGERIFNSVEIDMIIMNSGLISKKEEIVQTQDSKVSFLCKAARKLSSENEDVSFKFESTKISKKMQDQENMIISDAEDNAQTSTNSDSDEKFFSFSPNK